MAAIANDIQNNTLTQVVWHSRPSKVPDNNCVPKNTAKAQLIKAPKKEMYVLNAMHSTQCKNYSRLADLDHIAASKDPERLCHIEKTAPGLLAMAAKDLLSSHAVKGMTVNCNSKPTAIIDFKCVRYAKSAGFSVIPMPNITRVNR